MTFTAEDSARLGRAMELAAGWHAEHTRKGTDIPYLSHLLHVAALVVDHGGDAEQVAAALLHDAVEDTDADVETIATEVGPRVAAIVEHCTDTLPGDTPRAKSDWAVRKAAYVERLRSAPDDAVLVTACDKLHNLGALVADVRAGGPAAIAPPRFNAAPLDQLRYYDAVLDAIVGRLPERLAAELSRLVAELRALLTTNLG
jgi:(p)ppGpp synthase/HD superfamily hydrolase